MAVKLIVADDHALMREALCQKLECKDDFEVIGQADNGREAVGLCEKHAPDVIIMDVSMPDLNGIEAARRIHNDNPDIKIVALSMHSDQKFVVDMLKAGASAYLNKASRFEVLLKGIDKALSGEIYLDESLGTKVIKRLLSGVSGGDGGRSGLTSREREVLQMVTEGRSSKEIAYKLEIEEHTIVKHRQNIMNKLDIRDIPGLTRYALREGMIAL